MLSNGDNVFFLGRYVGIHIYCSIYGFTCFLLLKHFGLLHINSLLKKNPYKCYEYHGIVGVLLNMLKIHGSLNCIVFIKSQKNDIISWI